MDAPSAPLEPALFPLVQQVAAAFTKQAALAIAW